MVDCLVEPWGNSLAAKKVGSLEHKRAGCSVDLKAALMVAPSVGRWVAWTAAHLVA